MTFRNPFLAYSRIDYVFVSPSLYNSLLDVAAVDSGENLSDHVPVVAKFGVDVRGVPRGYGGGTRKVDEGMDRRLRWDKANLQTYYDYSGWFLQPILTELKARLTTALMEKDYPHIINDLHTKIVRALLNSDVAIPRAKATFYKHWWNPMLDTYKHRSIECCNIWLAVGSPLDGSSYHNMRQAKAGYKNALDECKKDGETQFAAGLFYSLISKDMDGFLRPLKNKLCKKRMQSKIV